MKFLKIVTDLIDSTQMAFIFAFLLSSAGFLHFLVGQFDMKLTAADNPLESLVYYSGDTGFLSVDVLSDEGDTGF